MKRNWEYKKLGEVCDFQGGSQPPKDEWSKELKFGYVRMLQIRDFTQSSTDYIEYVKESKSLKYCKSDDVLIGRYGASVGKILTGLEGAYNVAIIKSVPNESLLSKPYIKMYFSSPFFQQKLLLTSQQRAAQAGFSKEDISDFLIPVPPLDEQQRIVAELDLLTGIIDKQNAQLKELENLAQAIFYDMFGDPIENPKRWEVRFLENVVESTCALSYGIVQPGDDVANGVPVVRPVDLVETFVKVKGLKKTTEEISASYRRTVLTGYEILMCVRGTTGVVSLATAELTGCNVTRGIIPILPSAIIDRFFLYYVFRSSEMNALIQEHTYGATLKQINVKDVRNLPIILPPLPLQQSFAEKIQSIEKQKETIRASIADTQKLLDYTMDKYFGD